MRATTEPQAWLFDLVRRKFPEATEGELHGDLPADLTQAWQHARALLRIDDEALCQAVAEHFDLPVAAPGRPDAAALALVPESVARRLVVYPVALASDRLIVAAANPVDQESVTTLAFVSAHTVELQLASPAQIESWITAGYGHDDSAASSGRTAPSRAAAPGDDATEESAIANIVRRMIREAATLNASDIHAEPFAGGAVVRFRVDGILRRITTLPLPVFNHMVQRIKAITGMNVATRLVPQDGSTSVTESGRRIDLRISTIPVEGGEKMVIRLLQKVETPTLDALGIADRELEELRRLLGHPSGVLVMTGPTGSGKSTTLYSALGELNSEDRCLVTVEDPVEQRIEGIAQVGVNPAQGVTFSRALRALLRQDPDVVLVGEVRDEETAEITLRAALTGHFVLSTLHTNDAVTALPRLLDLGVPAPVLADALAGLAAQRLLRRLCALCAVDHDGTTDALEQRYRELTGVVPARRAEGCKACGFSGYKGRFAMLELLVVNEAISDAIRDGAPTHVLRRLAREAGMRTLAELAAEAVRDGRTSVAEVHRVLGERLWDRPDESTAQAVA